MTTEHCPPSPGSLCPTGPRVQFPYIPAHTSTCAKPGQLQALPQVESQHLPLSGRQQPGFTGSQPHGLKPGAL